MFNCQVMSGWFKLEVDNNIQSRYIKKNHPSKIKSWIKLIYKCIIRKCLSIFFSVLSVHDDIWPATGFLESWFFCNFCLILRSAHKNKQYSSIRLGNMATITIRSVHVIILHANINKHSVLDLHSSLECNLFSVFSSL